MSLVTSVFLLDCADMNRLSNEILFEILSFVDESDLSSCKRVCFRWNQIVSSEYFYKKKSIQDGRFLGTETVDNWQSFYKTSAFCRNLLKNHDAVRGTRHWEIFTRGINRTSYNVAVKVEFNPKGKPERYWQFRAEDIAFHQEITLPKQYKSVMPEIEVSLKFSSEIHTTILVGLIFFSSSGETLHHGFYDNVLAVKKQWKTYNKTIEYCHGLFDYLTCMLVIILLDAAFATLCLCHHQARWPRRFSGVRIRNPSVKLIPPSSAYGLH